MKGFKENVLHAVEAKCLNGDGIDQIIKHIMVKFALTSDDVQEIEARVNSYIFPQDMGKLEYERSKKMYYFIATCNWIIEKVRLR